MTIKSPKPSIETLPAITDTAAFDARFDNGEDLSAHIDWTSARRPNLVIKRVNVDFPTWVVEALDEQAERLGVTRQSLIKIWITDRLATIPSTP
jgi:hypothetical protein